jgi:hypothetical protein
MNVARLISLLFGFVCAVADAVLVLICSAGGTRGRAVFRSFSAQIEAFRLKNWDCQNPGCAAGRCGCWAEPTAR